MMCTCDVFAAQHLGEVTEEHETAALDELRLLLLRVEEMAARQEETQVLGGDGGTEEGGDGGTEEGMEVRRREEGMEVRRREEGRMEGMEVWRREEMEVRRTEGMEVRRSEGM